MNTTSINGAAERERNSQRDELTEVELSKVTGGSGTGGAGTGKAEFQKINAAGPRLF
jgi:hypothetical protein